MSNAGNGRLPVLAMTCLGFRVDVGSHPFHPLMSDYIYRPVGQNYDICLDMEQFAPLACASSLFLIDGWPGMTSDGPTGPADQAGEDAFDVPGESSANTRDHPEAREPGNSGDTRNEV